ncbi:MAG: M48 family metallopeptidase [Betaproteobacteria bacterium]|nr:M48 family metallopeptidase [Betaproteobacteria bacterium]MDE2359852.1 M48 family metallopeptidase [Betaproteobacteria bacterium]
MSAAFFTAAFVVALASSIALRLWLARRQIYYVRAHRDATPAAFASKIDVAAHRKAADYTVAKQAFGLIETAADAAVLLGLTLGGGLAGLIRATEALSLSPVFRDVMLLGAVAAIGGIASLPFSWWRTFRIEERFGFNHTTLRVWVTDIAKGLAVGVALGLPLAVLVLWMMRGAGADWWLWVWLAWMGFQLLLLVLYPTVIAPLFNRFSPLPPGAARDRIERLLARCDFRAAGLFVIDGSKRSGHGNAYFSGFGPAKRVVFFDTLLARLSPEETEAVLAHELGHFRLRHIAKRIAWSAALSLVLLGLLAWLIKAGWFYAGLGIPASEIAVAMSRPGVALALFMLALPAFTFALAPVATAYSRRHEFEADAFAARNASAAALGTALIKLYEDNASTLTPDPVYSAFYDSHPPASQRVERLMSLASSPATA